MNTTLNKKPMTPEVDQALEDLEMRIAKLLRQGVIVSGVFLLVGWMLQIKWAGNPLLPFHNYQAEPLLQSLQLNWLAGDWALLISYFGLFVLISLPILRVLLTAILFFKQGDKVLASVATFVFVAILASCLLGFEI